jgi:hypothetical protein
MSLRWTQEQFEEYQARRKHAGYVPLLSHSREISSKDDSQPDQGKEIDLQSKIERFCRGHGFYFFHDRSRECNAKGFPDLVIALKAGRVIWLELKSAKGRLRPDQKQVRMMLLALGHEWHEVRSYRQFLRIVQGEIQQCTID